MNDSENLANLQEARDAKEVRELLARFEAASKADGIRPDGYLGRSHALVALVIGRTFAMISEDRAHRVAFAAEIEERQLRLIEDARDVADTYKAGAKDHLATRDRIARKAEADLKHRQLELHDAVQKTLGQMIPQVLDAVKEGNVIRQIAFNRTRYAKHVAVGVFVSLAMLFGMYELGRMSKADPPPVATSEAR